MHHFFTEPSQIKEHSIYMEGMDLNHMKNVLRIRAGEKVEVSDGLGMEYLCELERYGEKAAYLTVLSSRESDRELPSRIFLFQGLPKSDKMELIIQKAVELGVYEVIPMATKRAVVKLDGKKAEKKVERWNSIARSGAEQSGRCVIPKVKPVLSFAQALEYAEKLDVVLIPYEMAQDMGETKKRISSISRGQSIGVFIGPEGGFEESEIEKGIWAGAFPITLGKRILRTETAGLTVLSVLMYHLEN